VSIRAIAALAIAAALLGGGYYLIDVRGRAAREEALRAERRVVHFDPARVRQIAIDKPGERVALRGGGGAWRIVSPIEEVADPQVVEGLLSFVGRLETVRSLDGVSDLAAVGLDRPAATLALTADDGQTLTLLLGGPNPVKTGVYAAVQGAPLVFLAPARLAAELGKTPYVDELRDRAILRLDAERITRFEIARHGTHISVSRIGDRQWRVERPFEGPGDDGIIRDLLWKIGAARGRAVLPVGTAGAAYGLDRPHARLTVVDDGGARTLVVAQDPSDPNALYAQLEGRAAIAVTDPQLLGDLAVSPDLLRNRQLLVYAERELDRITIRSPTAILALHRIGDRWQIGPDGVDVAPTAIENILEVLPNLRYASVGSDVADDLSRYGLDRPRLSVTVGLTGGRELPTLLVGREERGLNFVIMGNRAPIYRVDARLIRVIPAEPADAVRQPLPEQLKRELLEIERSRGS
jgi:hypothetical protein